MSDCSWCGDPLEDEMCTCELTAGTVRHGFMKVVTLISNAGVRDGVRFVEHRRVLVSPNAARACTTQRARAKRAERFEEAKARVAAVASRGA